MRLLFTVLPSSTSSLTVKINLTNTLCVSHSSYLFFSDTPSQRVQFILGTEEDEEHEAHDLFTELDEICVKDGKDAEWKETARYAHVLHHYIHCQKCNSGVFNLLDATTAKYDHSCAKRRCIFMQRTNLLCKKIIMCVKYYLENVYSLLCYIIMFFLLNTI